MKVFPKTQYYVFLAYLALLSMLGFVATDMYLPAFKSIEVSLQASAAQVAGSLTAFLAGLAIGQLLYGPLVAKIGKRYSLIVGMVLFAVASVILANAESIFVFNLARFVQAIGACSAGVIWQAIVIEKYDADKAQKVFSNIMPLVALSPALAPLLGAFVLGIAGWQTIFLILAVLALVLVLATVGFVSQEKPNPSKVSEKGKSYRQLLQSPRYLGNVIIFGACSGAFFSYLTVWPIAMEHYGYSASEIGLSFIPQTVMFIVGGYSGKLLIRKLGASVALKALLGVFFLCVAAIASVTLLLPVATLMPLLVIFALLAAANGAIYPIVVNNALQTFKDDATKAAGLQNFLQISIAFGASSVVAMFAEHTTVAIGVGIVICSIGVLLGFKVSQLEHWQQLKQNFCKPDPARIALSDQVNKGD
ncbi:Bcr/CflA family multidrug efflux MFS transporter [Shewanella sp. Scap07]|uniref:purine nucleoside transporter PunC n=1 Tax=Shewanella sp. Scap07 TaxID=2589987 RepID=UPI0015BD547D|nr:purine nucleoside transporter PunC [Shewanella sp. Scap07]QLE85618.1 Bcr/CflA family multidrug efflux MFS transporter [Shewanella sp. Scap07]